jgi:signal transduction histidine kinase
MSFWQFTPYAIVYISAAIMAFLVSLFAVRMRSVRTKNIFSLLALSTGIWVSGYLLGFFSTNLSFKLIMLRVEYLGIFASGYLWLIFIAKYTHQDKWLMPWVYWILAIIPLVSYIQIIFVENHNIFYKMYDFTFYNDLVVSKKVYGIGFFISAAYNYTLIIIGTLFLIRRISHMPERFWKQNIPLALVLIVVLIPNFLYISGNNPIPPYDPTPLSFVIIGILFLFAIYMHRFLNVVPVAYNLIFKDLRNGVIITDKRGYILDLNTSASTMFQCILKKCIGDHINTLFKNENIDIDKMMTSDDYKTEIQIGPEKIIYEIQVSAMEDYHKNIIGRIILLYNIDDQKKAIEELDAYSSTVAHDLKNPLSNIIGFVSLMDEKVQFSDEHKVYLDNIQKSAAKMNKIIESLLLLANIRNEKTITLKEINTKEIVETVINRLSSEIKSNNAVIYKPEIWPIVLGDPVWIEAVWMNYLSNALKYGGKPSIIELSSEQIRKFTKFKIKDNGNGISKEEQKKLFVEFSRLKRHQNKVSGHGLGLSIVNRIISKLGGQVGVESEKGKGATFWFTLANE